MAKECSTQAQSLGSSPYDATDDEQGVDADVEDVLSRASWIAVFWRWAEWQEVRGE